MGKRHERYFTEEKDILISKMTNKHMKRCSTSLAIIKKQIKTTTRYHYTSISMAKIKISDQGFPRGAGVRNPPANAGDTDSCPCPGRSHTPRSEIGRASCRERV